MLRYAIKKTIEEAKSRGDNSVNILLSKKELNWVVEELGYRVGVLKKINHYYYSRIIFVPKEKNEA